MNTAQSELQVLITAKDEASAALGNISGSLKTMSAGFLAVGGVITGAMALSVKAAGDAEVQIASLDATLASMGKTGLEARDKILAAGQAAVRLGFDDEEAANSIAKLFQRTGDLSEAMKMNALAMDLARAKHLDLTTASNAVGMVLSGNGKVLKQYGIDLKETASPAEALAELQGKLTGQAQAYANTAAGAGEVLKTTFGNLQETIGQQLLPVLIKLAQAMSGTIEKVLAWTAAHPQLTKVLVIAITALGLMLTALGTLGLVIPPLITGLGAFGAVLTFLAANPLVLIIGAVVGLVAALVYLMEKNGGVIKTLNEGWLAFQEGIKIILTGIRDFFFGIWDAITGKVDQALGYVLQKLQQARDAFNTIVSFASAPVKAIGSFVSSVGAAITGKRAGGGDVMAGGSYIVGERGPELFVPRQSGTIIPNGAGGIVVNINGGTYLSERVALDIGDMIVNRLKQVSRISR